MLDKIRIYTLAMKYWMNGDSWSEAKAFAEFIVNKWKK